MAGNCECREKTPEELTWPEVSGHGGAELSLSASRAAERPHPKVGPEATLLTQGKTWWSGLGDPQKGTSWPSASARN